MIFSCAALAAEGRESLADNSPFIPHGWQPDAETTQMRTPAASISAGLVFQGVYRIGGTWSCNLLDTSTGKSSWINTGQSISGAVVLQYDPALDTVYLLIDGRETGLRLKELPANTEAIAAASNDAPRQAPPQPVARPALANATASSPARAQPARTVRSSGPRGLPDGSSRETWNSDPALASLGAAHAPTDPQPTPFASLPPGESPNFNPRVFAGQARNSTP